MNPAQVVRTALGEVYNALDSIASGKSQTVHAVTVSVNGTNLNTGVIAGTVTVNNRSRRNFKATYTGNELVVRFMGQERRIAA